jgi:uncharacterized protein
MTAVEGWFTVGDDAHLTGSRCAACGTVVFPPTAIACPNPACDGDRLEPVPLSRRGTVWSWTVNRYQPPPPYVPPTDPFEPFAIVAVELADERMVVLGQFAGDPAGLHVGQEVELVIDTLFDDQVVWKWAAA